MNLADEAGAIDAVDEELGRIITTLAGHGQLARALMSPSIPAAVKKDIGRKIFAGETSPLVMKFLFLLIDKEREKLLELIVEQYRELARQSRGTVLARVTTAVSIDQALQDQVTEQLAVHLGRRVVLESVVDPDILGGMVIVIGDRMIDASVSGRLEQLRERLGGTRP